MTRKTELLATAGSLAEAKLLLDAGADALAVGEQRYGMRLPGDFTPDLLTELVTLAKPRGVNIYAVVNAIMDNAILPELPGYLETLRDLGVDAVVFGDPAVLMAMKQVQVKLPLHWNPEMTATNYASANYWATKGATRVVLARELNMEQVLAFKRESSMEIQVQVHGITNIYHSKRALVHNYFNHMKRGDLRAEGLGLERGLYLIEEERRDERFPIYEDTGGTHIMSSEDICMLENVHEFLEAGVDSLKIEGLLKSPEYNATVVRAYRKAIDAYTADPEGYSFDAAWLADIEAMQPEGRPLSYGFYYKEQVY